MFSYEEIPGTVMLKNYVNLGSVVAQDFREGWRLPSMAGALIFTGTSLT